MEKPRPMTVTVIEDEAFKRARKLSKIIKPLAVLLLFGAMIFFFARPANAFFWQNPVQRFQETSEDFAVWETQRTRKERGLFYDHCSALEWKQERGEEIKDIRYLAPCKANDISLYFDIRDGFTSVGSQRQ